MSISKEENITQIIDGIKLSTFSPKEGETIFITVDLNKIDLNMTQAIFKEIKKLFPFHNMCLKVDGIALESQTEDDLK